MPRAKRNTLKQVSKARGVVVLDTLIGLLLLGAMMSALLAAFGQHRQVTEVLKQQRAAVRALEAAAVGLRPSQHQETEGDADAMAVQETFQGGGWVELTVEHQQGKQSLVIRRADDEAGGSR